MSIGKGQQGGGGREAYEVSKFNRQVGALYAEENDLLVEPVHWEKFDAPGRVNHPYAYVVRSLGDLRGRRVLELGCGTGLFSVILVRRGAAFVEAFDISDRSIALARTRARVNGIEDRTSFKVLSIYDMDYPAESFDRLVGINILHHVDITRVVDKIHGSLKPGGTALFLEPFGQTEWLEKLRLLVPVKVDEVDKSHWREKLKYRDVAAFRCLFPDVSCREFHLFSRLDRVISSKAARQAMGDLDSFLLGRLPFLRRYARSIVIEARKPAAGGKQPESA